MEKTNMRTLRKAGALFLCAALLAVGAGCAPQQEGDTGINRKSDLPDYETSGGTVDIYAYFPGDTEDVLRAMFEADFNAVLMTRPNSYITTNRANLQAALDTMEALHGEYDFKTYPFTGHMVTDVDYDGEFYSYLTDYDCVGGLYMYDEPWPNNMADLSNAAQDFLSSKTYGDTDSKYLVTLHPSTVTEDMRWVADYADISYEEYVLSYIEDVAEEIGDLSRVWLSADIYPIVAGANGLGERTLKPSYLYNVGVIAAYAQRYGLETNIAIQALDHLNYPVPTVQDLRLQVNTLFAFGIDTYSVYTFDTPTITAEGAVNRQGCYLNGKPTVIYDRVKQVNGEVRAWDQVYTSFEWQGVITRCSSSVNDTAFRLLQSVAEDENLLVSPILEPADTQLVRSLETDGDILLGYFTDEAGNEGYMLTNYAETQSGEPCTTKIAFAGCSGAYVYENGVKREVPLTGGVLELTLEAGGGAFIVPFGE